MNVDIQSLGFETTAALADHAKRRLRVVLTRHSGRIQRVVVRLGDENGPRGGIEKFCRIQVYLLDAPVAVIEEIGPDLYDVMDRAANRVGRVVVKHIDRSRIGRRHDRGESDATPTDELNPVPTSKQSTGERA